MRFTEEEQEIETLGAAELQETAPRVSHRQKDAKQPRLLWRADFAWAKPRRAPTPRALGPRQGIANRCFRHHRLRSAPALVDAQWDLKAPLDQPLNRPIPQR